eukprot:TRINITY_DN3786_c0_g1_i2.p1 TRINITY_DN3786_c0_g1~~TRINITY_DN3786_c0_g1_i2.p1  ORF type:complete len:477 (-),score=122.29 TRINITY_DN3786_c0_g1_i2:268-1566(-)
MKYLVLRESWSVAICTHEVLRNEIMIEPSQPMDKNCDAFFALDGDFDELYRSPEWKDAFFKGTQLDQAKLYTKGFLAFFEKNMRTIRDVAKEFQPDLLMTGQQSISECLAVGQKMSIPLFLITLSPISSSIDAPSPTMTKSSAKKQIVDKVIKLGSQLIMWNHTKKSINQFRKEMDLPSQKTFECEFLPQFVLVPASLQKYQKSWPSSIIPSGFWNFQHDETDPPYPPAEIASFFDAKDPPIFIGFGTIGFPSTFDLLNSIKMAFSQLGKRAIVCLPIEEIRDLRGLQLPDTIRVIGDGTASLRWMFARCCCVVHHGNHHYSSLCLSLGIPSVIYPLFSDQPFWAKLISKLKVGPETYHSLREFNSDNLKFQLESVLKPEIKATCLEISSKIRSDSGSLQFSENFQSHFHKLKNCGKVKFLEIQLEFNLNST